MDVKFLKDEAVYCDHASLDLFLVLLALQLYHFPIGTRNQTSGSTFTFQNIANAGQQQLLFVLFLGLYLITVVGNLLSVLFIRTDYQNFLLAVMAYDHYLAIYSLLRYSVVMSPHRCVLLVVVCWLVSHLHSLLHSLLMTQMTFCPFSEIPLFFFEVFPLLKISCSDSHINLLVVYTEAAAICKAFSTCSSHLAAVWIFCGTVIWVYFQPSSSFSSEPDTIATVIYTMITPLLNPLIYSLRNRDLHQALRSWPCAFRS
ncbi:olfactory receptor 1Q1-like [Tachyglossus aculeatus]|uniref:olfactory receptor 1Q1-like n=1 Tax=Tachyglossus aculeatus TaxID=9261 RepID=UPI0018F445E5|nr:olfactory receptor 1Q1-like [Tachyglossus aculeatus]